MENYAVSFVDFILLSILIVPAFAISIVFWTGIGVLARVIFVSVKDLVTLISRYFHFDISK